MKRYILHNLNDLVRISSQIIDEINKQKINIIVVEGEMGAGKTTIIKEICTQLNVIDTINSPTFSIVNEYITTENELIFHFDCYRIESINEANEIGISEYLDSGKKCFIEWHQNIASLLPDHYIKLKITVTENNERYIDLIRETSLK